MKKDIVITENRAFEGVWIPKKLYLTNKFNLRTKFFIVEIKSLSKNGYCFATDKHFSNFLGIGDRMVQNMIKQLKDDGYLTAEYEYEKDTKAIKRRFLILTQKFYDEFYNEEEIKPTEKNFDNPTEKKFNRGTEKKFNRGTEKNCEEKYNNKINNTDDLNITKSSNTEKGDTTNKFVGEVDTSVSEQKSTVKSNKRTYSELKELETDMLKRVVKICDTNLGFSQSKTKEVLELFEYYFYKYTQKTGKIHPILTDSTLERIINELLAEREDDENHKYFGGILEYEGVAEAMIDTFFEKGLGEGTDYHISHFATNGVLLNLGCRANLGEI